MTHVCYMCVMFQRRGRTGGVYHVHRALAEQTTHSRWNHQKQHTESHRLLSRLRAKRVQVRNPVPSQIVLLCFTVSYTKDHLCPFTTDGKCQAYRRTHSWRDVTHTLIQTGRNHGNTQRIDLQTIHMCQTLLTGQTRLKHGDMTWIKWNEFGTVCFFVHMKWRSRVSCVP